MTSGPRPDQRTATARRGAAGRLRGVARQARGRVLGTAHDTGRGPVMQGFGASGGRVTGTVRLVRSPQDFSSLQPGEVLVAPATSAEWTPLFATAAAVVTDVGGAGSHAAMLAGEHCVPAVLGTGIATRRLATGMVVTVDGDRAEVELPVGEAPLATGFRPRVPYKFALGAAAVVAALVAGRMR